VQPEAPQSIGDAVRHNEELSRETGGLEEALELLKVRYEQWFMGLERREPAREREEMKRAVARIKTTFTRNTGLRFRIQSLYARFISYERMWQRSAREKEEGTYRRDVLRARRSAERVAKSAAAPAPATASQADASSTASQAAPGASPLPAAQPPATPAAAPGRTPAPRATPLPPPVPGMSEAQLRELHAAYVAAKRSCNEDTSRFTVDALARSLAKQVPDLLSRFQTRGVDFRVAVKDGKTILKAVPRG
jgi:hypothetical protein